MNADRTTVPRFAALDAFRVRQESGVRRWLRLLAPLVMVVVVWTAFDSHPGPGLHGYPLAVSVILGGFLLSGIGALLTQMKSAAVHIGFIAVLIATSVALMWLQPSGSGVAGVFVGLSLLAPRLRGHRSIPLAVLALVFLGPVVATAQHGSVVSALLNAIMLSAFYGMMFLAMRLGEANQKAEQLLAELERGRAAQAEAAGMAERQRLAREMHDVLAHSLSGLMLQLEGARMMAAEKPGDPRLPEVIERAHHLGKAGLEEARRAIGTLRDDELPGPERLSTLAAQFEQDRGIPCILTVCGEQHELGSESRLALYRVAQEALTNVAKHAQPERVELRLAYTEHTACLVVEDFAAADDPRPHPTGESNGYGLAGMRERAELLGGTLLTEATDNGFRVQLDVPT
ncbi:sensor histidine kinase [Sciscionella marina]|uniref:sensor histidine kinase n=1 Tax=Sciscionella marina TaxID=508770 RepID=UPI0003697846|nr:sensor histidine kinase [Sciscionella marina]